MLATQPQVMGAGTNGFSPAFLPAQRQAASGRRPTAQRAAGGGGLTQHRDEQGAGAGLCQLAAQPIQLLRHALPRPLKRVHPQRRLRGRGRGRGNVVAVGG